MWINIVATVTVGDRTREHRYEASEPVDMEDVALDAIWASGPAAVDACSKPYKLDPMPDGSLVSGAVAVRLRRA
jgi:hypothetical protein